MTPWSLGCRMNVVLAAIKTACISLCYPSIRVLGLPGALPMKSNSLNGVLFWAAGLKMFSKLCCKQICIIVLFMEHRQSRFSIVFKGPKIFGMLSKHWLQLSHHSVLWMRISLETLNPGIDFSSPGMKALGGIFFQQKAIHWIENLLFSVNNFINYLS